MKLYGSLSRLVAILFRKDSQDITVRPNQATTYTAARDIQLPPGDAAHVLMSANSTATMTNKTFDADGTGNSISNIENADIKSGAAIDAAKIHDGSVSNTEFGFLDGVTSSIQGQFNSDKWKQPVRAASTANVVIASELENGDTLDGVTLATGDRVLLKDQSTGAQNGIYIVAASGAASRAVDADASAEFPAMFVQVQEGTANADTLWFCSNNNDFVLGTDTPAYSRFRSASASEVTGPGSATDEALARFDGTTGKIIQNSSATLSDAGAFAIASGSIAVDNLSLDGNTLASTDTNGNISLDPNGTGAVSVAAANLLLSSGTSASELRFYEPSGSGSNYTALKAQAQAGDVTYTLPAAAPASNGYVLAAQTDGTMSWVSNASTSSYKTDWLTADGTTKSITHSLGTTDVMIQVFDSDNGQTIELDIVQRTDANTVDLTASEAPATSWRVMIVAV